MVGRIPPLALDAVDAGGDGRQAGGVEDPVDSGAVLGALEAVEGAFNRAALGSAGGGFGNLGRNVLRGPRQMRFDLALSKETRITERLNLELRFEGFNVFNNVNFALPSGDLSDSEFGQITNTVGGPRTLQVGARFRF